MRRKNVAYLLPLFLFLCLTANVTVWSQDAQIGLRDGFNNPPEGYGEVPFWWWTGEKLDVERLNWQLDELKKNGISGVQVNYAHQDVRNDVQPNWLTYPNEPEVLTDEWFDVFEKVAEHCRELNMGVGLSGYTLDWQYSPNNLFDRLIYRDKETQSRTLYVGSKKKVASGQSYSIVLSAEELASKENDDFIQVVAYPVDESGRLDAVNCQPLDVANLADLKAEKDCEIWIYRAKRVPCTLNPLHPDAGAKVVERFFQPFEKRAKEALGGQDDGKSTLGLNYFFQDELQLGTGETIWTDDAAREFEKRKGYSYWTAAPAMFDGNVGSPAEKYRLDYMDVRVKLAEERYFMPIYAWNANRGRIYACDPGSRGREPYEFCDYFSAIRWYTAPGHDTPGGRADFIKNKVSSSIAHFYNRPRVWLEGYHSFGWGAEPKQLFFATNQNFLFGANLLNLHGLYYTTYGGYWEWAPPCYHFRMPYWSTFGSFLKYFERLSFALTRGVEQTDVVVLYPVSAYQSKLNGNRARDVAFEAATRVFAGGRDVLFIDDESIQRAEIRDGKLCVAGGEHGVLILPSTQGVHWKTLQQALELYRSGGTVIALDAVPVASDRAGRDDPELAACVRELFGVAPGEEKKTSIVRNEAGGVGAFISSFVVSKPNDEGDRIGSNGTISKTRVYPGGFAGHWVWSEQLKKDVYFKWVATGLSDEPREYSARLFCDNSGSLYVNGKKQCEDADYSSGWTGNLTLRNGDVVTLDGHDDDTPRRGSAGLFFALSDGEKTLVTAEDFRCSFAKPTDAWRTSADGFDALAQVDVGNVHVLHRTGVNSEAGGQASANAPQRDDARMWAGFAEFMSAYPRDVFGAKTGDACSVMKRTTDDADIYFVMKGKKGSEIAFRSQGKVEFLNPWDGTFREAVGAYSPTEGDLAGTTVVSWPYAEDEAGLVVFWKNEKPSVELTSLETNVKELDLLGSDSKGAWNARAFGSSGEKTLKLTTKQGDSHTLRGSAKTEPTTLALDGDWGFELKPTIDNRWGDFRLPINELVLGAETQRFDVEGVGNCLYDFGRKFMILGPLPNDANLGELEACLATLDRVDSHAPIVEFNGKRYAWRPYSFSWRWGIEGNPGREGYHGLKEKIDSRFIGLGATGEAHNETVFRPEDGGSIYYLWTTVGATFSDKERCENPVDVYVSGGTPGAVYLAGKKLNPDLEFYLDASQNAPKSPVLIRSDAAGRYACCFVRRMSKERSASRVVALDGADSGAFNGLATGLREETPEFVDAANRVPLSTIWFNVPGVLDYDVLGGADREDSQRLSFVAPPGLKALTIPCYGIVESIEINGQVSDFNKREKVFAGADYWRLNNKQKDGSPASADVVVTVLNLAVAVERESRVSLTIKPSRDGVYDGALCPEPIRLVCGEGVATLGDWNSRGVLENYSGAALYTKTFEWDDRTSESGRAVLDLGNVGVSCRVFLNGIPIGELSTPPWKLDVTDRLHPGENKLEVFVYSALANFYKNIPSRYKGVVPSGLIGPVELRFEPAIELRE
ncbi:MAG: hypothetical protein IK077_04135 [Thermoguttaceae bacterium]|nr:hypothetical protein [Thermoguttaceae bacterium]